MGVGDAEDYYNSAIYGDPVEVTNTGGPDDGEGRPVRLDLLLRGLAEALGAVAGCTGRWPRRTQRRQRYIGVDHG